MGKECNIILVGRHYFSSGPQRTLDFLGGRVSADVGGKDVIPIDRLKAVLCVHGEGSNS